MFTQTFFFATLSPNSLVDQAEVRRRNRLIWDQGFWLFFEIIRAISLRIDLISACWRTLEEEEPVRAHLPPRTKIPSNCGAATLEADHKRRAFSAVGFESQDPQVSPEIDCSWAADERLESEKLPIGGIRLEHGD
jgi:hypothetical protein